MFNNLREEDRIIFYNHLQVLQLFIVLFTTWTFISFRITEKIMYTKSCKKVLTCPIVTKVLKVDYKIERQFMGENDPSKFVFT